MSLRIAAAFLVVALATLPAGANAAEGGFAIAIHGGAGGWPGRTENQDAALKATLKESLAAGRDVLAGGGSSLDAVERAIVVLENSPFFNAGKGAVYNAAGRHQLDASIMRGSDLQAGAVAAIGVAKNPIRVARLVMTETRHVLLAGAGANAFATESGVETVEPDYFWTPSSRRGYKASQGGQSRLQPAKVHHYGTVGCVALDMKGDLAAGTSTGGLQGKMIGRVGDSPLIAAGTYADNRSAAISCTGVGELFIRGAIAYDIAARVRYGVSGLDDAVAHHLDDELDPGTGGVIAIGSDGQIVTRFNTDAMPRGMANSDGRFEVRIGKAEP